VTTEADSLARAAEALARAAAARYPRPARLATAPGATYVGHRLSPPRYIGDQGGAPDSIRGLCYTRCCAAALEALTAAHLAAVTPSPDGGQHPAAEPPGHVIPPRRRRAAQTYTQTPDEPARLEVRARALRTDVDWMGP